jgi:hypothetical protein
MSMKGKEVRNSAKFSGFEKVKNLTRSNRDRRHEVGGEVVRENTGGILGFQIKN